MKLAKLSLAAIVVAGLASSSFAADNLADAFKNGKVSGELKAFYFDRTNENKAWNNENVTAFGATLGYVTDSFYGFKLGLTAQSSTTPWIEKDAKTAFSSDMYAGGAQLSEAYLQYTLAKTDIKIGRQFINTPLASGSGARIIRQSFQGVVITNTDLPQTTLFAAYVDKYQTRTYGDGDVGKFTKKYNVNGVSGQVELKDGAYTLGAINKSIPGLTITGQWEQAVDVADLYFLEIAYAGKAGDFTYGAGVQGMYNRFDANSIVVGKEEDTSNLGIRFSKLNEIDEEFKNYKIKDLHLVDDIDFGLNYFSYVECSCQEND